MANQLSAEEFQDLQQQIPHFQSSEPIRYLADRKLLPQQHGIESFENPSFITKLRRATYGHTRQEQQLLKRQQEALVPFQQEQELKTRLRTIQEFQMANAPSPLEASATYGLPLLPSQQPPPPIIDPRFHDAERTWQMKMERQQAQELGIPYQNVPHEGVLSKFPPRIDPSELHDPIYPPPAETQLRPWQVQALEDVRTGRGVFEGEQYTPMPLAKPRADQITPEQFLEEVGVNEQLGNVPPGTTETLRAAPPGGPFPARAAQQALSEASRRMLELAKDKAANTEFKELENPETKQKYLALVDKTSGDVVRNVGPTPRAVNDLIGQEGTRDNLTKVGLDPYLTALKAVNGDKQAQKAIDTAKERWIREQERVAAAKAAAQTVATQNVELVPPEKQSNYIHAKTFGDTGQIVYPQSTSQDPFTKAKAATGGWREITDKQKEAIRTLEVARGTQSTLMQLAHQLIQAKGPGAAFVQGMRTQFGAFIRSNDIAAAFMGDREAFSSWMARMVEVGVLTQQDISRWASVLPDQRDTVGSAVAKEAILNMLFDSAELANRRAILGDVKGLAEARKTLQEQIRQAEKLYNKGKNQPSAQELFNDEFGGNK